MIDTTPAPPAPPSARDRAVLVVLVPLAALVWWLVGALPELLDRFFDALSGMSQGPNGAGELPHPPVLASPLGGLGLAVPNAFLGGIVAGSLGGWAKRERRIPAGRATLAGIALGLAVVMVQAAAAGPEPGGTGLLGDPLGVAIALAMILAALVGGWLGSRASTGRLGIGIVLGVASGVLPLWLMSIVFAVVDPTTLGPGFDLAWIQWSALAVLVLALVTVGLQPLSRARWWPLVVVLSWVVVTAVVALPYLLAIPMTAGSGTTPASEQLSMVWQTVGAGVWAPLKRPLPWLGAVGVAAGIALVRARTATRPGRPVSSGPDGGAAPR